MTEKGGFEGGAIFFVLGLVALFQGSLEATILLCGIGIAMMASSDPERMSQVWDLFFGGFSTLLRTVFQIFRN